MSIVSLFSVSILMLLSYEYSPKYLSSASLRVLTASSNESKDCNKTYSLFIVKKAIHLLVFLLYLTPCIPDVLFVLFRF